MKKNIVKTILIVLGSIILLFIIDLCCIKLLKKPIFATTNDVNSVDKIYYGVFYNTYYCFNEDKMHIISKKSEYVCNKTSNSIAIGIITDIKDNYIIIKGISDNNYLKKDSEAHVDLSNNPKIIGANNLIIGQHIEVKIKEVKEIYPSQIITDEINIVVNLFKIVDKMTEDKELVCAESLELFYGDENNEYFFDCIKSEYVVVRYPNGDEITVKEALNQNKITITNVLNSGIHVIKRKK